MQFFPVCFTNESVISGTKLQAMARGKATISFSPAQLADSFFRTRTVRHYKAAVGMDVYAI